MELYQKAIILIFLLAIAPIAFATDPATTRSNELQAACLNQNPPGRTVWAYSTGPPNANYGQGGDVQTNQITPLLNGYCVQIDCIQNPFSTGDTFQYCKNGAALYKKYDVTFSFPVCRPIYTEMESSHIDAICAKCPDAVVDQGFSFNSCQNGVQVLSRPVTSYYDSACTARATTEYQFTSNPCFDWAQPLGLIIVLAVGYVIFIYRKRLGFK